MKKFENMGYILLLILSLFFCGCGSDSNLVYSNAKPKGEVLSGSLHTKICIVSFADVHNSFSIEQSNEIMNKLNRFIYINSNGSAWLDWRVESILLPGLISEYNNFDYLEPTILNSLDATTKLQRDCLVATRDTRSEYMIYVTPFIPEIYLGYGSQSKRDGSAWLSAKPDIWTMPFPHEFGHMLGFPHYGNGIMSGDYSLAYNFVNYDGLYDNELRKLLGWSSN